MATRACINRVADAAIGYARGELSRQQIGENLVGIEDIIFDGAVSVYLDVNTSGRFRDNVVVAINLRLAKAGKII